MPTHPVPGEGLPRPLPWALSAIGVLMATSAAWVGWHPPPTQPGQTPVAQSPVTPPVAASALTEAVASVAFASAPSTGLAASTPQADSAVAMAAPLPPCPPVAAIYFPSGKTTPELPDMVAVVLAPVVDWARQSASARLSVEGHADAVGEDTSNLLLSYTRARTVAAVLAGKGVAPQQLQVTAAGGRPPTAGRAGGVREDRRVTVQLQDPERCRPSTR